MISNKGPGLLLVVCGRRSDQRCRGAVPKNAAVLLSRVLVLGEAQRTTTMRTSAIILIANFFCSTLHPLLHYPEPESEGKGAERRCGSAPCFAGGKCSLLPAFIFHGKLSVFFALTTAIKDIRENHHHHHHGCHPPTPDYDC